MKEQLKQIFAENADCKTDTWDGIVLYLKEGQTVPAMTESTFIEVVSELMNEVEMKLKEPNFYIVNSKKYLTDEQRISVAEKITQMSTIDTWTQIKSEDDLPKDDKNVLVIIEGQMQIMCLCSIIDNDVYSKVWCMVYDGLNGDGIYDDNYYPTHWMPLPTHPQPTK